MPERWLPVLTPGYEDLYEISNRGRVKSLARLDRFGRPVRERILKQTLTGGKSGKRYAVGLRHNGIVKMVFVHVLMLEAFVGPRPPGMLGCHRDDTPRNDLDNLRWDTGSANILDQVRNGNHFNARRTECKYGHALAGTNLYVNPNTNERRCRQCERDRRRTRKSKKGVDHA